MKARVFDRQFTNLKRVADKSFEKVFYSMQLLNYTVLYYDFDFSKDDIKRFNENIKDYNNSCLDDKEAFFTEERRLLEQYGFDCEKASKQFPARAKIKMLGKAFNSRTTWDIPLTNATDSINVCLVLFLHELTTTWNKSAEDIALYWEKMKENSMNYENGMTDEFVLQYFREQIDLDITIGGKE